MQEPGLFKIQKQADCQQNLDVTQKVTLSTRVFGKNLLGIKKKGGKKPRHNHLPTGSWQMFCHLLLVIHRHENIPD